jgi:Ca-activated chloride channel family protein
VTLDQPAWLILLVLLPLLGVGAIVTARLRSKQWATFVAPRLRGVLLKRGSPLPRWFALAFLLAACAALIVALARPQGDAGTRTEKTLGRNVLIALDLSRSMRVADVKPDRLAQAKMVIYELLEAMPNERIGLIGFAGSAYLYAPLTVDHGAVRETVEQIDETWATLGGSNLAEAISLAVDTFKKTGQKNNALVILSDGEKHDGDIDDMIAEAELSGVFILAIGVGTEDGDYVPNPDSRDKLMHDRNGEPVISRLQPDVMRRLASETKGRYAVAGTGMDIPAMVKTAIKDLDAFEMEGRERRVSVEFYQWLLLPAIVFLLGSILAGTRWRGIRTAAMAGAVILLAPSTSRADAVSDARQALVDKRYAEARSAYQKLSESATLPDRRARYQLGEANAAYLGKDYKNARTAFSRALLSDNPEIRIHGAIGLGNTLFQLGWRGLTEESYPDSSQPAPDLAQFDERVKQLLAKLKAEAEPDKPGASGYGRIETLITNWADAVRHYDSVLAADPAHKEARNNRGMTMTYLKRLQELLKEDKEETEQSMPQPQPGEGEPQPGEGDPDEKQPGEQGEQGKEPPPGKGEGEEEPKDGKGGDKDKPEGDSGKNKDQEKKDSDKGGENPDEQPEERARRILKENADLEKGPLTPGRREFRAPEKDW